MLITRTIKTLGVLSALSTLAFVGGVTAGTIVGTKHDFSDRNWSGGEICIVCHTPHNADISVADAPLWNHELTTTVFELYDSPTFDGSTTITDPAGSSVLCLSCHDGTVALDSFGGTTGTTIIGGRYNLGETLLDDHPISFTYDAALVALDGGLHSTDTLVTIGSLDDTKTGTIQEVLLFNNQLQCASCHDVH
ncbi:MAG: cytochrome C, partial [Gammaproteobacteria bacterium]|nr:cytochrome C [Gammaproteobacteria bacterium]